jgi:hypothetical protein
MSQNMSDKRLKEKEEHLTCFAANTAKERMAAISGGEPRRLQAATISKGEQLFVFRVLDKG